MSVANKSIVRRFIADWSSLDADRLAEYFVDDGVYHNMPTQPVVGKETIRQYIAAFLASWDCTDWEILNLVSDGELVFVERMDRTVVKGKAVNLPCCGVFELRNGKIAVWRDYFDRATFVNAVTPNSSGQ